MEQDTPYWIHERTIFCPDIDGHKCRGSFEIKYFSRLLSKGVYHHRVIQCGGNYRVERDCSKCKFRRVNDEYFNEYTGQDLELFEEEFDYTEADYFGSYKSAEKAIEWFINECHEHIKEKGAAKLARRKPRHVYAFELENTSVKIGVSANIKSRQNSVSNQSGMKITRWYATEPLEQSLAFSLEAKLHAKFKDYRKQGEFFQIPFDDVVATMTAMT